ncbi:hypothetical protein J3458_022123 [Metarhizium acridum]|uniref:uncharacterized protein n=1 Tax=Metarhizium acridum TaxID=92637 RepID=UPI001C6BB1D6|nr:hypothetical protein J3458_022123 [Metarhizium acridum]
METANFFLQQAKKESTNTKKMSSIPIGSAEAAFTSTSTDVLEAYNRQSRMYDAKMMFHKLLDDLSSPATMSRLRDAKIGIIRTIEAFEREHTGQYVVFQLAMSTSPRAFRSVLSGTIAWEASRTVPIDWYHAHRPGVYAVGVAVDGRGGRFLTAWEIQDLARGGDKYASGYQALQVPTSQRITS